MPLAPFTPQFIVVDIPDRTPGLKRRATFKEMHTTQNPRTGVLELRVVVEMSHYADVDGAYGPLLDTDGITSYDASLYANNATAVFAADVPGTEYKAGDIALINDYTTDYETKLLAYGVSQETVDALRERKFVWTEVLAAIPQPLMLQGDFFLYLMHNAPVVQGDLLRMHIGRKFAV